jgi:hypothetical protein
VIAVVSAMEVVTGQKCSAEICGNFSFLIATYPKCIYFFLFAGLDSRPLLAFEIFKVGRTGIGSIV